MATLVQLMENLLAQKNAILGNETRRILLKEFLQAYNLDFLYNHPVYRRLNFYGGTCLHIIYGLDRLTENIYVDNNLGINITYLEQDLLKYFRVNHLYAGITATTEQGEGDIRRTTLKFPDLFELGLTPHANEALYLKVEVSQYRQVAMYRRTPVLLYGRSFVAAHFSLETMMAGKMLACLERNFQKGEATGTVKGRDFYDLLWFMQQGIQPLEEKLEKDGLKAYTVRSAFAELEGKITSMHIADLGTDLLPLFEQRTFVEGWLEGFKENFGEYVKRYI